MLISGGGRCNVTNTISDPIELAKNYPRGYDQLTSCFQEFSTTDTKKWFESRGVRLKTEADGRVFPISDDSRTIANALQDAARQNNVDVILGRRAEDFVEKPDGWDIHTNQGVFHTDVLVITTGSSPSVWKLIKKLGLNTIEPVPSLFTFHCKSPIINQLPGISFPNATVSLIKTDIQQSGPILITHEGLSGPAILKLSAWAARELNERNYKGEIKVNWLSLKQQDIANAIRFEQESNPKKHVVNKPILQIPKRFWTNLCALCDIPEQRNFAEIGKKQIAKLTTHLLHTQININGKSTNKEEFVTAGGVDLEEMNLVNFQSKNHKNLYLAGEVLNIDAVTGGFNFQAAWTAGYLIGTKMELD